MYKEGLQIIGTMFLNYHQLNATMVKNGMVAVQAGILLTYFIPMSSECAKKAHASAQFRLQTSLYFN